MENITKSGIYKIINTSNNKFYIGSTVSFNRRKSEHFRHLRLNKHINGHLQNSYNKYGKEFFEFIIVEYCENSLLMEREQFYLDTLKPNYNLTTSVVGTTGYSHTEKAKKVMSLIKREQYDNGLTVWNKDKTWSQEIKNRISQKLKGKYTGVNHPFYGKTHTEENKKLMVAASHRRKGTHHTGHNGRIFKLNKDSLEVLAVFSSSGAAVESINCSGSAKTARTKIAESIKYNRNAYGYKWLFEKSLAQVKVDELLETLSQSVKAISREAESTLSEPSETT